MGEYDGGAESFPDEEEEDPSITGNSDNPFTYGIDESIEEPTSPTGPGWDDGDWWHPGPDYLPSKVQCATYLAYDNETLIEHLQPYQIEHCRKQGADINPFGGKRKQKAVFYGLLALATYLVLR